VAKDILKKGGTAVDAAIAANAMLGLVEPTGCVWAATCLPLSGMLKPKSYMDSTPVVAHLQSSLCNGLNKWVQ